MGVIAMKLKTAAVVTGIVIATGAVGLGVGAATRAASPERAPASRERRAGAEPRVEDLLLEVDAGREREAALRRELDAARGPEHATAGTAPATEVSRARDEARRLKVPPEALLAALRAEEAIAQNRDDAYDLIREVQRYGEGGFRAALAIVLKGAAGEPQWKLLDETFLPGLEGLLLDTIDSQDADGNAKWAAIHTLAKADTPAVREYLVARIEYEKDRGLFEALAKTLAELKEPRAAKAVGVHLLFDDPIEDADWGPMRSGMLWQLGQMGGEDAKRILRDFVLDARVTDGQQLTQALQSLYLLDRPVCGEVARRILEEPRGKGLSPEHAAHLRNFAALR